MPPRWLLALLCCASAAAPAPASAAFSLVAELRGASAGAGGSSVRNIDTLVRYGAVKRKAHAAAAA